MTTISAFARTAALIGDPGRAAMLWSLMDGRALAAGELARVAGLASSTASEHLAALREAGLIICIPNGRHRYYRLASTGVASLLENVMNLSQQGGQKDVRPANKIHCGPRDPALRRLRRCYDHLAGEIAVAIADSMVGRGQLRIADEAAILTSDGTNFLSDLGITIGAKDCTGSKSNEILCRPCLDWSERRYHLAGFVGTQMFLAFQSNNWFRACKDTRALYVTRQGGDVLKRAFGLQQSFA